MYGGCGPPDATSTDGSCYCDRNCHAYGNCCADLASICPGRLALITYSSLCRLECSEGYRELLFLSPRADAQGQRNNNIGTIALYKESFNQLNQSHA